MSAGTAESALLELLTWEMGGFCITYEWMALVRVLKARPWKWKRVLKKWWVEMKREDLLKQIRAGMESTMAPVTGTAEFTNEGRLLEVVTVIQPQTPRQHEMLEQVAKLYGPENAVMEKGNLVLRRTLIVSPEASASLAMEAATVSESSTQSGSASESAQELRNMGIDAEAKPNGIEVNVPGATATVPEAGLAAVEADSHAENAAAKPTIN